MWSTSTVPTVTLLASWSAAATWNFSQPLLFPFLTALRPHINYCCRPLPDWLCHGWPDQVLRGPPALEQGRWQQLRVLGLAGPLPSHSSSVHPPSLLLTSGHGDGAARAPFHLGDALKTMHYSDYNFILLLYSFMLVILMAKCAFFCCWQAAKQHHCYSEGPILFTQPWRIEMENWTHIRIYQIQQYHSVPQNSKRGKNMNAWHILSFKFETTAITAKRVFNSLDTWDRIVQQLPFRIALPQVLQETYVVICCSDLKCWSSNIPLLQYLSGQS